MIIKVCGMREPQNIREVAALAINWKPDEAVDSGQWTIDS